jgi:polyketide synthase 12
MTSPTWVDLLRRRARDEPDCLAIEFSSDGVRSDATLTYAELDSRARSVASQIQQAGAAGERAILLLPSGLEFAVAFFGCLYAGVAVVATALPHAARPEPARRRLHALFNDVRPAVVVTTSGLRSLLEPVVPTGAGPLRWILADIVDRARGEEWRPPAISPDTIAVLQYTSGSTASPRGVIVTHGNLLINSSRIQAALDIDRDCQAVSWLPPHHDMGLVGGLLQPIYTGFPLTLLPPAAVMQQPTRWLRAIARTRATHSGGPNFVYELCARSIREPDLDGLDLGAWRLAYCGAEPVRSSTLDRFADRFGPYGFRREALFPCYGLAEATLLVSGARARSRPTVRRYRTRSLDQGCRIEVAAAGEQARALVACGMPEGPDEIAIVDPLARVACLPERVGEIWVSGPSVARGYFARPDESARTFEATRADTGAKPYLRTGDLGFVHEGDLFITGRIKDLVIVRGQNLYPEDIEQTASASHAALEPHAAAAFALDTDPAESLIVVHEVTRQWRTRDLSGVADAIRRGIVDQHDVDVGAVVLIAPRRLPRTSSGKVQRHKCREAFLEGTLAPLAEWRNGKRGTSRTEVTGYGNRSDEIRAWLTDHLARELSVPREALDHARPLASYGLDSAKAVRLAGELETWLGQGLPPSLAYECPTIDALARRLSGVPEVRVPAPGAPSRERDRTSGPIAIIGMGCRLPGAPSPPAFWTMLCEGVDAVREVPPGRWDPEELAALNRGRETPLSRWGGFLDRVDGFDCQFFGISPHEATRMDPQQRLLLEVAWEAIEDAGLPAARLAGTATGVFVGIATADYSRRQWNDPTLLDGYAGTGNAFSIAANRLSYLLDLRGPSIAVDTACSSSLVAVHLACQSLLAGDATLALAGGVNLILSPAIAMSFTHAGAMAPDGRCKAFDRRADGYVRSEGAGVVVLKPLAAALSDGDRVYGVIRGSAVNQDGRSNGLLAPSPQAQETVIAEACRRAGVEPQRIDYIEAHGTGTQLGDPIEARAIAAVVRREGALDRPCRIGSVKTNIGHLEAAAGIAGLIKVALALHHDALPPSLHFEHPNPQVSFRELGLQVQTTLEPWPGRGSRLAGVSSFGFGGTNAHVVIEGADKASPRDGSAACAARARHDEEDSAIFVLSGRSPEALVALATSVRDLCAGASRAEGLFGNLCRAAALRRDHHDHRLGVVARNATELADRLDGFIRGTLSIGCPSGRTQHTPRRPVFVFPGQGSQWIGMARDLLAEPAFRRALESCNEALRPYRDRSLVHDLALDLPDSLDAIDVVQPVLFGVEVALAATWRSWGIEPGAVIGHSMGEIAAACVAGALSLDDAARVVCERSRLLRRIAGQGGLMAVELAPDAIAEISSRMGNRVSIAACNGPSSTVLAGDSATLAELAAALDRRHVYWRSIKADVASHSAWMDPLRDDLIAALHDVSPRGCSVPIYSSVTGALTNGAAMDAEYWWRNLRQTVQFERAIASARDAGFDVFVEVSPHPILLGPIQQTLFERLGSGAVLASLRRGERGRDTMLASLAALYTRGHDVEWNALFPEGGGPERLPAYPWQRKRCWLEAPTVHPLLGACSRSDLSGTYTWQVRLHRDSAAHIRDHRVQGVTLVPAAAFIEMALAASGAAFGPERRALTSIELARPLLLDEHAGREVRTLVSSPGSLPARFSIDSRDASSATAPWIRHATGAMEQDARPFEQRVDIDAIRKRCPTHVPGEHLYRSLRARGIEPGPSLQGVMQFWPGNREALGELAIAEEHIDQDTLSPALVDAALQLVSALQPDDATNGHRDDALYLPTRVGRVLVHRKCAPRAWAHVRLGSSGGGSSGIEASVRLMTANGELIAEIEGVRLALVDHNRSRLQPTPIAPEGETPARWRDWLYEPRWKDLATSSSTPPSRVRRWLIVPDRSGVADALAAALTARGDEVAASEASPLAAQWSAGLGVIHLSSLDRAEADPDIDPQQTAEQACGNILQLVREVVALSATAPAPRLWLVTRGAQAVAEPGPTDPALAPVWGLGRAISLEHPELACTLIDLDPARAPADVTDLVDELIGADREDQVAFRGSARYVLRLERRAPAGVSRPVGLVLQDAGRPESLTLRPITRRPPGSGEMEIRVHAAGLNFRDYLAVMGLGTSPGPLGGECAGTIVRIGDNVHGFRPGEAVVAVARESLASLVVTDARGVARKPAGLSFEEAATLPIAFLTAWYGLHELARLEPGERVLIHLASGGVGLAAVQIAQLRGAEIFATAGTPGRRASVESLGVSQVFDSRTLDFVTEVRDRTGGRGVDVILNSLAGQSLRESLTLLAPHGRFLELGKTDIVRDTSIGLRALGANAAFFAIDIDLLARDRPAVLNRLLSEVMDLVARGLLTPLPREVFSHREAARAIGTFGERRHIGKLVLSFASETPRAARSTGLSGDALARKDAVCLVTGGLGALGLEVARWLVDRGARHLVLAGRRSHPDAAGERAIASLEASGAIVQTVSVDVADSGQIARLLADLDDKALPLCGVVHAAGVLDDATVLHTDADRLAAVMRPKVRGAWNLHRHTAGRPLDFFILFSSAASVVGSPGQAGYAAANAYLDALAAWRRARGLPATCVNWGPWSNAGLAVRSDRGGRLEGLGVASMMPDDCLQVLTTLLDEDASGVTVLAIDWARLAASHADVASAPLFSDLTDAVAADRPGGTAAPMRLALLATEPASRLELLSRYLRDEVAKVLGHPPSRIDLDRGLDRLGFDSLMAVQLKNRIESDLGITIPLVRFMQDATIDRLVALALTLVERATAVDDLEPAGDDLEELVAEIEQLPDEEARRLLTLEMRTSDRGPDV